MATLPQKRHMRLFFKCEAATAAEAAAATLSMSMGSECPAPEEPEEVSEEEAERLLGVEAAVDVAELLLDEAEAEAPEVDGTELLLLSGRLALIHGWFSRSLRVGRSLGRTLRHLLMMSWHSWVRRVRKRTSAVQMASSFS
jgi:hypothetical protein